MEKNDFTSGAILPKLLKFMLPVLFAMFLQSLYGAVDLLVVGRFSDNAAVSAVSTGSQIIMTLTNILVSFSMGITVAVGQKIGQKRPKDAARTIGTGLVIFAAAGLLLTVISVIGAEVLAVVREAAAVLQEDRFRRFGQELEAQALEEGAVLRLGEDFHIGIAPFGSLGDQPGNQGDGEAQGAGFGRDGETFDDVPLEAAAGEDGAVLGENRQIQINFPEPETIAPEEVFHLAADGRTAPGPFLYVDPFKWFHHPAGFPILPVPPQIDLTL